MKSVIASLIAVAGMSVAANGQCVMKMLVSTDGTNFSSSVNANPGQTVTILVTCSYTGSTTNTTVAGFGSAIFQPTVSNWHVGTDTLLPLRQGGNTLPADGSGMVLPQGGVGNGAYGTATAGGGTPVGGAGNLYNGGYGRVMPFGRTFLDGSNALRGWEHTNPNGDGVNYLRIAQSNVSGWIGTAGNTDGLSGVNCAQLYCVGRTESDPDFWGRKDTFLVDPGPPESWDVNDNGHQDRRVDVQLFRFAITLDSSTTLRTLTVDAPINGQQINSAGTDRYIGYYSTTSQSTPGTAYGFNTGTLRSSVQTGLINIVPSPASMALLGLGGLVASRRRRA